VYWANVCVASVIQTSKFMHRGLLYTVDRTAVGERGVSCCSGKLAQGP